MTRIAVTCVQMQRDLATLESEFERLGVEVVCPPVVQALAGDDLVAALADCAGVIAGDDAFTADVIARLPGLRAIAKWGVGIDGIDLAAAAEHGVAVSNTPGAFDDDVADIALAYLIGLARGLHLVDRGVRAGGWPKPVGRSVGAMTVGVIGLGGIGRAFGRRGLALGARVMGADPVAASREAAAADGIDVVGLDDLLARVDAVSLHCPLTPETRHMLDARAFAAVRPGLLLVNTARGPVIDETALVAALERGQVAAAALDVFEAEPLAADHPLRGFEQVVLGSHNASNTAEACARVHHRALANLADALGLGRDS